MTTKQQMAELEPYLDGMRAATTAEELEAAFQQDQVYMRHGWNSRGMRRIEEVRVEEGLRLCAAHPAGRFVPVSGPRRRLEVCGETCRIARGGNSTGVRYAWHYAETWAIGIMTAQGLSLKAAHGVWSCFRDYPHRALQIVEEALAGRMPDPQLNVLIRHERRGGGSPIRYSVEENESGHGRRASRPCPCGGTLFDWGGGHSAGFEFVEWRCIACPDVFTEYMTKERFYALRSGDAARQAA
jgi:hypothetical protein